MFEDIGNKIKTLAKTICWIGITITIIITIVLLVVGANAFNQTTYIVIALVVLCVGCLLSWLGSLRLYGFGELINNSKEIKEKLNHNSTLTLQKQPIKNNSDFKITEINNGTSVGACEICHREAVVLRTCKVENTLECKSLYVCENCINNFTKSPRIPNHEENEIKKVVTIDIVSQEKKPNEKQCISCGRIIPISQEICKCGCEEFNI